MCTLLTRNMYNALKNQRRENLKTKISMGTAAIILGILGLIAGTAGTIWSNKQASKEADKNRKQTYELNEKAAENALEREKAIYSEFQSPEAKMKQLQKAGLSPALMYDSGAAGGIGQISPHSQGGAQGGVPSIFDIGSNLQNGTQDLALKMEQAKLLKAQREKTEKESGKITVETGLQKLNEELIKKELTGKEFDNAAKEYQNIILKANADVAEQLAANQVEQAITTSNQLKETLEIMKEQKYAEQTNNRYLIRRIESEIQIMDEQIIGQQLDNIEKNYRNVNLLPKQKEELEKIINKADSEAKLNEELKKWYENQSTEYDWDEITKKDAKEFTKDILKIGVELIAGKKVFKSKNKKQKK